MYDKTTENNSLLEDLKSFCYALILVTSLFYIGLSSFSFDHSTNSISAEKNIDLSINQLKEKSVNSKIEICQDIIFFNGEDYCNYERSTLNTRASLVMSDINLSDKLKIEDPVTLKSPTGLSSSFDKLNESAVNSRPSVLKTRKKPKIYKAKTLSRSISLIDSDWKYKNGTAVSSDLDQHCNNKLIPEFIPTKIINIIDHIPTDQTIMLMASNEIEVNDSYLEIHNSDLDCLAKKK